MARRVLFLCTGNYYRSRFAEHFFNHHARRRQLHWEATSRGLEPHAHNFGPISVHAVARLRRLGIWTDDPLRFPRAVHEHDFAGAQHVVAVKEAEHRPMIAKKFPRWLDHVEYWSIDDVDVATPEQALPRLEERLDLLLERFAFAE